jgi:transposase-like protein
MSRGKRIRRSAAVWRHLFSRQSSGGLSVPEFCRREGINASLFRRWRSTLKDSGTGRRVSTRTERAIEVPAPFIDLGDLRSGGPRFEVRLDLGSGVVLSIARS